MFSIELLHEFFRNGRCNDFRFVPNQHTQQLLANYRAIYKTIGNRLVVLIKVDATGKPFVHPSATDKFSFYLELLHPVFMTYSNIELSDLAGQCFYFSNLSNNKFADADGTAILYLSQPAPDAVNATNYTARQFVKKSGDIFECVKDSTGATTNDPSFWINRHKKQYASGQDLLTVQPFLASFPVSPAATEVQVTVAKLNLSNQLFDIIIYDKSYTYETAVEEIAIDLSNLPEARYKISVNGNQHDVYLSNEVLYRQMFAVIDIFHHLPDGDDFALLAADGTTKDKILSNKSVWQNYTIRFSNRTAYWKYLVKRKGVQAFDATPYVFNGNASPADEFTSSFPIPLQEEAHQFKLTLFHPISSDPPFAPNPDIHASGMLSRNGSDYYCNIFLNY